MEISRQKAVRAAREKLEFTEKTMTVRHWLLLKPSGLQPAT